MAKIAIAGGHSSVARGACGYIDEYECDRAYVAKLIAALEAAGHTVIDCSNEEKTVNKELKAEVKKANASNADWFLAVHFNAGGGTGTEVWYYTGNNKGYNMAKTMSANVANALGLRNRGAKSTTSLYVVKNTNMPAVLLETCFVDTKTDADAWHATSWGALTEAVVKAFEGTSTGSASPSASASKSNSNSSNTSSSSSSGKNKLEVDGYWGSATVKALQKTLGTTVDGVVSGQDYRDMNNIGGKPTAAWQLGKGGSKMIKALQRKIGVSADGYFGSGSCKALQKYLGTTADGVISKPSAMVKELQRRLNAGTF